MAFELKIDFSQLYRAALAERDPLVKEVLLQNVQCVLDAWREENAPPSINLAHEPASSPLPVRPIDHSAEPHRLAVARRAG